jgi:sulfur carrier protein
MQLVLPKEKVDRLPSCCHSLKCDYPLLHKFPGMDILINEQLKSFPDHDRISADELVSLSYPASQNGIALAIGDKVIPKTQWKETFISAEDKILIFKATQGG